MSSKASLRAASPAIIFEGTFLADVLLDCLHILPVLVEHANNSIDADLHVKSMST
jgi:hypothetical protein